MNQSTETSLKKLIQEIGEYFKTQREGQEEILKRFDKLSAEFLKKLDD